MRAEVSTLPDPRRRGVALIIVLGLMSVLVIMAISFVVVMRTERLTARGFVDDFRVRELCYVSLSRALAHLESDAELGMPSKYPPWSMYPPWPNQVLHSGSNTVGSKVWHWYMMGSPRAYIPRDVQVAVDPTTNDLKWVQIGSGQQYVGRVCYSIMNCSGHIDANGNGDRDPQLGRSLPRIRGTNANEIQLSDQLLPGVVARGTNLYNGRVGIERSKAFARAETVRDLWIAGRYLYGTAYPLRYDRPEYLTTFSHFPTGYYDSASSQVLQPLFVGGDVAQITSRRAVLLTELQRAGLTAFQSLVLYTNLIDYVDSDFVPGNLDGTAPPNPYGICSEPIPMINEIVIGSALSAPSAGNVTLTINLDVEVWYPFFGVTNPLSYSLSLGAQQSPRLINGTYAPKNPLTTTVPLVAKPGPWLWSNPGTPGMFQKFTGRWTSVSPTNGMTPPDAIEFPAIELVDQNGKVVDGVKTLTGLGVSIRWNKFMVTAPNTTVYSGWRANDPRINWRFPSLADLDAGTYSSPMWSNEVRQATSLSPGTTLLAINLPVGSLGEDGRWQMHVRNRPFMPSVCDLGLLLYEATPWRTLEFMGPNGKPRLLDFLTTQSGSRRGIVNVNTSNELPLATAFYRSPRESVPGASGNTNVDAVAARAFAQAIMQSRPAAGYTNLSDLARAYTALQSALPAPAWRGPDRESILRNSERLLGTRQNLFIIALYAESVKRVINPEPGQPNEFVQSRQAALAEVWRDPYKTIDPQTGRPRNRLFVTFFRWLDD